jgi:hypothetical protein
MLSMYKRPAVLCVLLTALAFAPRMDAQDGSSAAISFTADQLDNLLAPIALYPDPLLAQILPAATFPDQIDEAARFMRANDDPNAIDSEVWDVSVKAVAHYRDVLEQMADDLDWTTTVGQAYALQPDDVLASIQRLRHEARSVGNLESNAEQEVVEDADGDIEIWPIQPQYIYIPVYDSSVAFFGSAGSTIGFTKGFPIGAWLNYDFDWRQRHIIYAPWKHGTGWRTRSLPYVHVASVYVNDAYANVAVNRNVVRRKVNYSQLGRFDSVHATTDYGSVRPGSRSVARANPAPVNDKVAPVKNKMIERNIDTSDPRIAAYRGQETAGPQPQRPKVQAPPARVEPSRPAEPPRPVEAPRPVEPPRPSVFSAASSTFDARESSQRGQESRQEMARPAPPPPPPPPAPPAEDRRK